MDFIKNIKALDEDIIITFFESIYKKQQFGNRLLTDKQYNDLFPKGWIKEEFLFEVLKKYPDVRGPFIESTYTEITRISFDSSAIENILLKKGIIKLCPFRKKQVAIDTSRESSHYEENFLPCYQEKCMLYKDESCSYGG